MTQTAVTAPAFSVLDLPGGERNLIGLARVSTDAQDAQLQQDALTAAGCCVMAALGLGRGSFTV